MNADNVQIARPKASGCFYSAPADTESSKLPSDAATALNAVFADHGWISEDGIVQTIGRETTELKGFGGDTLVTMTTKHSLKYKLTPLELTKAVLADILGDENVTETQGVLTSAQIKNADLPNRIYVFDMRLRGSKVLRVFVPNGKVVETGDMNFKGDAAISSEITIEAYPDASGVKAYLYFGTVSG